MTKYFNKIEQRWKRKLLRNNPTKAERVLWNALKGKKMKGYIFRRQYGIERFIIDFYCPREKLALELDGESHNKSEIITYDLERQNFIESFGNSFLRIQNNEVLSDLKQVLVKISEKLSELDSN